MARSIHLGILYVRFFQAYFILFWQCQVLVAAYKIFYCGFWAPEHTHSVVAVQRLPRGTWDRSSLPEI